MDPKTAASSGIQGHPPNPEGWDPKAYPEFTATMGPVYLELHDAMLDATSARQATSILDLGTGTGEAVRRLLTVHQNAAIVGVDVNQAMLDAAAASLPSGRARFVRARLEEPLPSGPFDLVVSVLAVHHLNGAGKSDLFKRIYDVLGPGGRFVLADAVCDPDVPRHRPSIVERLYRSLTEDGVVETVKKIVRRARSRASGGYVDYDDPDLLTDQLAWLSQAGFHAELVWEKELCVVVLAERR